MIEFKSSNLYFDDEQLGLKPFTIREIDNKDGRFLQLIDMMHKKDYGRQDIKITRAELPNDSFVRQIKHITKWQRFLLITWRA